MQVERAEAGLRGHRREVGLRGTMFIEEPDDPRDAFVIVHTSNLPRNGGRTHPILATFEFLEHTGPGSEISDVRSNPMSEPNFPCPSCGQTISWNNALAGAKINCPHCLKLITVSTAPLPDQLGTVTGSAAPVQKTSGLAIASLACSLASIITCIGWLPGIICGHMAKAKIRRNPALKGNGLATAGLVIGYLFLAAQVSYIGIKVWRISSAVKQGFTDIGKQMATNHVVVVVSNVDLTQPAPGPDTVVIDNHTGSGDAADPDWKMDPDGMSFPDHPASGKIHGNDFALRRAVVIANGIRLVSANRLSVDVHGLADIEGKSFEVHPTDAPNKIPHVQLTWPEGVLEPTALVTHGYAMKLEFGQASNGTIPGKIYVCFPDDSKSWLAGTFDAQQPKATTATPAPAPAE